jgi:Protein of unknown function (DUF2815)
MNDVIERTIVKKEDYAVLYSDQTILVKEVRLSYPHLDKPWKGPNDTNKPKYSGVGLMPKTSAYGPSQKLIMGEIAKLCRLKQVELPDSNKFLRDGDSRPDKKAWVGHWSINASEEHRPGLRGLGKDPNTGRAKIITPEEALEVFYPGCWVNMVIKPWFQSNIHGRKCNANLLAVQFVYDDDRLGEGRISAEDIDESFGIIEDSGYEDDNSDL